MKKIFSMFLFFLIVFCGTANALEIVRQKNVATRIVFPIVDADGDSVTGATGLDSEIDEFADGANPTGFTDCTNEATEIGSTGIYYLTLTASEMNQDYNVVQIKTTSSGAKTQVILIRTIAGDPKAAATVTTAGNSIDVASTGEVGLDFSNIKDAGSPHTLTNITVPTVTDVTNAVGVKTGTGANQLDVTSGRIKADTVYWNGSAVATPDTAGYPKVTHKTGTGTGEISLSSGAVTVGTNNDKTGYTASTVSDKTGYSIAGTITNLDGQYLRVNTAQAGASGSITLDASASSTDSLYNGNWISILSGMGAGQSRLITGYTGSSKVAAITPNWTTNPSSSSVFAISTAGYIPGNNGNVAGSVASVTGNVGGSVASVTGAVTVGTNNDKTGYSLTQSFPANFSSLSIDGSGRVDLGKWIGLAPNSLISGRVDANAQVVGDKTGYTVSTVSDKTGYSLSAAGMALFFTTDTTKTYADSVNGSVVKEIADNAGGSALTVQDIVDGVWDEAISGHLTSATTGAALNAAGSAGDPWSTPLPGAYGSGTAGYIIGNNINATISSRSSHSAADVWAVTTRLLTAGTNISLAKGTGITGFNDLSAAQVNSEVDTALSDIKLDKLLNSTSTLSSDVALGSVIGQLLDNGTSWSFDRTTDSLEALRDRGDSAWITSTLAASDVWAYSTRILTANTNLNDPSAAVIADAVWDEARSGHTTSGSFGQGVASVQGNVTGSVGSVTSGVTVTTNNDKTGYSLTQSFPANFSTLSIDSNGRVDLSKWIGVTPNSLISGRVDANAQVIGDKTGYSLTQSFPLNFSAFAITAGGAVTVGTNNDKTGYALTSAEEDAIVDKVWDESRSGHVNSGSFGQGAASVQGNITGSVNSVTSGVTVSTNNDKTGYRLSTAGVDDIWDESQSGHTSAGTFGKYLDAQVSGATAPSAATVASAVWEETASHVTTGTMGKKLNDAALAGNPWEAASICDGLNAGQCLSFIKDSTDGDKEGADYTGIEKTIRAQR